MKKEMTKRSWLPTRRHLIQLYAALLYNAQVKGYISGNIYTGNSKNLCVPGLNCYSCPGAIAACPLGALQNALASTGTRAPYYVLGILLLFGLTLGRTICGWLCPFGLIQELLYKVPTPKLKKSCVTHALSYLKYVILIAFVIAIPLYYALQHLPMPAFCKYICPAGTFEGAIGLMANPVNADKLSMLNILFTRKFVILLLFACSSIFVFRCFCRFLCPLGAIYGLFARINLIGVKVEEDKCTHCGLCTGHCKMDIRRVGDHECIHCAECVDVCPKGALSMKAGPVVLKARIAKAQPEKKSRRTEIVAWTLALLVLGFAFFYFNRSDEPTDSPSSTASKYNAIITGEEEADGIPVGKEVGMIGPDFTVPLCGNTQGTFHLADTRGKPTVINFWATWCTPCCAELPNFNEIYAKYGDEIAMVALHSDLVTDDVDAYLSLYDYTFPFAMDDSGVIASYGGSTMLPQTIILDRNGKIVYNEVGSMTYELLDSLIAPLLAQ